MPMGPAPLGLVYFVGVKLAGYSAAGYQLNRLIVSPHPRPIVFGVARTALGLAAGISFGLLALKFGLGKSEPVFYVALLPIRVGEWLLILWYFYRRANLSRRRQLGFAAAGTAWSYVLDLPAVFAVFAIPGGAWVC
jgi:hypothetical protein